MPRPLPDEVADLLREMIVAGQLLPGGRIDMRQLCKRFGVSRTPIREALKVLATEGLVRLLQNRSAVVAWITPELIDELVPIVAELEVMAGQLACHRVDAPGLARFEALYARLARDFRQRDERSYMVVEDVIRETIFAVAANQTLTRMHDMLIGKLRWRMMASAPAEWDEAMAEQERMLCALRARDGELWAVLARRHVRHRAAMLRQACARLPAAQ